AVEAGTVVVCAVAADRLTGRTSLSARLSGLGNANLANPALINTAAARPFPATIHHSMLVTCPPSMVEAPSAPWHNRFPAHWDRRLPANGVTYHRHNDGYAPGAAAGINDRRSHQ